jgi:Cu+-exporting ATPase
LLLVPQNSVSTFSTPDDVEKGDPLKEAPGASRSFALVEIDAELLEAGDLVRVPNGSTPPADGTVFAPAGNAEAIITSFDESSLTGESRAVTKHHGDEVFLGTINKGAAVDVKIKTAGEGNMYAENATRNYIILTKR